MPRLHPQPTLPTEATDEALATEETLCALPLPGDLHAVAMTDEGATLQQQAAFIESEVSSVPGSPRSENNLARPTAGCECVDHHALAPESLLTRWRTH